MNQAIISDGGEGVVGVLRGETSGVGLMVSTEKGQLSSVGPELGLHYLRLMVFCVSGVAWTNEF